MKPSGLVVFAIAVSCAACARGADATSPVDFTQRNTPFTAAGSVVPDKKKPMANETVQQKRFEKSTIEKSTAPLADWRAAVDVTETRDKRIREKESHRPEKKEQPTSAYNHREARISTSADTTKPPLVAKYQDSLVAASATNMARFPAMGSATSAKINRFVFRKNPPDSAAALPGAKVTPAAGGPAVPR